jgi:hypothetical protein
MQPGTVVRIFAAIAGYQKYHLCLSVADDNAAAKFLFINSDPRFDDTLAVDNDRVPCIPPNDTGKSCFSFSMVPRYSAHQLGALGAIEMGEIDLQLASELRTFADTVRSLAKNDMDVVKAGLDAIILRLTPA